MRKTMLAALIAAMVPAAALAQTANEIKNAEKTPQNVLTYGMSYSQQRFSPLTQINKKTVKRLVPAWTYSLANDTGEEAQPLVYDGVMYVTSQNKTVAVDALTGKEIWNTPLKWRKDTVKVVCCGIVNRGAAIYNGKLFRTTLDAHVIALDMKTGAVVWDKKSGDAKDGIAMTGAPVVAHGVVIAGMAGAEYGSRGYIEGYDPETGKRLWRHYTVPRPGEPGSNTWPDNAAKASGGSSWTTGAYDPDLDLVYWGVGNPAPWNPLLRKGDDLYTDTVLALRPTTGKIVWYYQTSPNDPFDHDNITAIILADKVVNGKPTKVLLQAARNGFYYVLDRKNGELIAGNPYVKVTWASSIDQETGRPVWTDATKQVIDGVASVDIWPSVAGGTNWFPSAYNPRTGLAYVNTLNMGMTYTPHPADTIRDIKIGDEAFGVKGVDRKPLFPDDHMLGHLKAIDPMTGESKWDLPFKLPNWSGTLVTAGGLVFTGELSGEFIAVDSDTGQIVWQFQTPSGIVGQPITWEHDGKQYVTVTSGAGGVYYDKVPDPNLKHVPRGGSLWTFALIE